MNELTLTLQRMRDNKETSIATLEEQARIALNRTGIANKEAKFKLKEYKVWLKQNKINGLRYKLTDDD